jgi:subtilisin-like proprotein convertase family protein
MKKFNLMKKTNFTKIMTLCLMFCGLFSSLNIQAQCPVGQTRVNLAMSGETFTGENGFILWNASAGVALARVGTNNIPGVACPVGVVPATTASGIWTNGASVNVCAPNLATLQLFTYESFGDNWNGGRLVVTTNETGAANGCNAQMLPLFNGGNPIPAGGVLVPADDNDLIDGTGDGGISCANPLATNANPDSGPIVAAASFSVNCILCNIAAPANVTAPSTPGLCAGNVTLPLAVASADCGPGAVIVNNFNGGGANASGVYPVGTTIVKFSTLNGTVMATTTVTVIDTEGPALDCPANETRGLDAGECNSAYYFEVGATDNCPQAPFTAIGPYCNPCTAPSGGSALACSGGSNSIIQIINVPNAGGAEIDQLCFNQETFGTAASATINVYAYSGGPIPYTGGGFTPIATVTIPLSNANNGQCVCATFPAGLFVPAGITQLAVEVFTPVGRAVQTPATCGGNAGTGNLTYIVGPLCGLTTPGLFSSVGFALDAGFSISLVPPALEAIPSPTAPNGYNAYESGDLLPVGTHCFQYEATDAANNVSVCTWCVTVIAYNGPTANCAANGDINVSVDENCEAIITPDMVLEGGPYKCYENYRVTVTGLSPASAIIGNGTNKVIIKASQLNGWNGMSNQFSVQVKDPAIPSFNCWNDGWMLEDKDAPVITCDTVTISCLTPTAPGGASQAGTQGGFNSSALSWTDGTTGNVGSVTLPVSGIPAGAVVNDVNITIQLDHSWMGDVDINLTGPNGQTVALVAGNCGINDNVNATFDSEAANGIACAAGATAGPHENCPGQFATFATINNVVRPVGDLSVFYGAAGNGTWTLTFADNVGGDGGCLNVGGANVLVSWDLPGTGAPTVSENCGAYTLTHVDSEQNFNCAQGAPFVKIINRTWTATDQKGNSAVCTQVISITPATLADVACPVNYDGVGANPAPLQCHLANVPNCANPGWNILGSSHPKAQNTIPGNPNPDAVTNASGCTILTGTGYPTGISCGNLGVTFSDVNIPICEDSWKVLRTWTIVDWCTGQIKDDCVQIIKIADNLAPVMTAPAPINVSTTTNSCTATFFVSKPVTTDNCNSNITYTVSISAGNIQPNGANYVVTGLPIGTHTITWIAKDGCNNTSAPLNVPVTVTDGIVPVAVCETFHVVNLTTNEPSLVYAATFDDGSHDNCGILSMRVRRMTSCINFDWTTNGAGLDETPNGCVNVRDRGLAGGGQPCGQPAIADYPAVPFACCDVGNEVMVEFRVTDVNGNTNTCMVTVEVDDKLDPVISCPPNKTLECSEYINEASDIAIDGLSQNAADGSPAYYVELNGPGNADNDTTFVGYYANAFDNCEVTVYIRDAGTIDECGETAPFINRFYTAVDGGGRTDVCVQRLTVVNSFPYFIVDTAPNIFGNDGVVWPTDRVLPNCDALTDPAQTGAPIIQDGILNMESTCSQVAVTYTDLELPVVDGACKKILRTWTIIDWCQYNNNVTPPVGIWKYEQIIKVEDNVGPTIVSGCENVTFAVTTDNDGNANNGCTAPVTITLVATDASVCNATLNYTFWIDYFSNGTQDQGGTTNSFSGVYPIGVHTVTWSVEDACGNITTCQHTFTVADQTAPYVFYASDYVTTLNNNGVSIVWATEFQGNYGDECSGQCFDFRIRVPSAGPGQTAPPTAISHTFTTVGTFTADWWIKDCAGNWTYVTGTIVVQDGTGNNPTAKISGDITTEAGAGVNDVTVSLSGNAPGAMPTMLTNAGEYEFANLELDYNYTVTPEMYLNPLNGVSTYDLVLISKHILQTQLLDSPYKMIAADVNMSGNITTFDMVALRKLILFIDTQFPVDPATWRFVESDFIFPNAANPWQTTFPEQTFINGLTQDEIADFVAIKKGDVNGSANPGLAGDADGRTFNGDLIFNVADRALVAGNTYTVDFAANDFNSILGYQFSLAFDNNAIEVTDVQGGQLAGLNTSNFGMSKVNEGIITTSWNSNEATSLENNAAVFSVTFTATKNTTLSEVFNVSSRYTVAEAYNANLDLMNVAIEYTDNNDEVVAEFNLLQNTPNPFKNQTVIGFTLPAAAVATLNVYDVTGKVIRSVEVKAVKGYNEVTLDRSDLSATGVLYYQLNTAEYSATKKMIIVD